MNKHEIRCVSCLKFFASDEPGLKGIFPFQSFGAGVCPNCKEKYVPEKPCEEKEEHIQGH